MSFQFSIIHNNNSVQQYFLRSLIRTLNVKINPNMFETTATKWFWVSLYTFFGLPLPVNGPTIIFWYYIMFCLLFHAFWVEF